MYESDDDVELQEELEAERIEFESRELAESVKAGAVFIPAQPGYAVQYERVGENEAEGQFERSVVAWRLDDDDVAAVLVFDPELDWDHDDRRAVKPAHQVFGQIIGICGDGPAGRRPAGQEA